ncbi:MAG TPA: hypothetical protein VJV78_01415 [Polyangiales bacterium]|nr:hypothetical protein [Polyangiales bacterium]
MSARVRKILLIAGLALLGLELVYVIVVNVLLSTGELASLMNQATDDIHLEIRSGWSAWPGRVHADEVQFRFEDRNLQFLVVVEHAVVDIRLWQLPAKIIHLTRVRGDGTRYLFRHKVEDLKGLERRVAQYAKIPGFSDPPLIKDPRTPSLNDDEYNLWTIHLEDADVGLRELWFQEYRYQGPGRARGGFRLQPERDAQTERCKLDLDGGTLTAGPHVVMKDFSGTLEAELDRHDPRQVMGEQIFGKISLKTELRGEMPNLDVTQLYTQSDGGVQLERGAGSWRVATDYEHGEWQKGSRVSFQTEGVTVRADKVSIASAGEASAEIVQGGRDARVELSYTSPRVDLGYRGVPEAIDAPFARGVRVALQASADLTQPQRLTGASADLRAVIPAMRWLNQPLDAAGLFTGGRADAGVHARWAESEAGGGELQATLQKVAMKLEEEAIEVSGNLEAQASYDPATERGQFHRLELSLPELGVSGSSLPGNGLKVRSENSHWHGMPPDRSEGRFELTADSISALLPFVISSDILRTLTKALVNLGKTRAVVEFEQTKPAWELRLVEAKSGDVEAFGRYRAEKSAAHPCGRWYVQDGSLSVGVLQQGGETSIKPLVSPSFWRERPASPHCSASR